MGKVSPTDEACTENDVRQNFQNLCIVVNGEEIDQWKIKSAEERQCNK